MQNNQVLRYLSLCLLYYILTIIKKKTKKRRLSYNLKEKQDIIARIAAEGIYRIFAISHTDIVYI
jgi:hypothetical protein